ncbi:MAG: FliI/YscN family ATPase [Bdellovibrionales bacterium]|nr:FliI/YscN family ATPase [Bdellovibrionales bacterium]
MIEFDLSKYESALEDSMVLRDIGKVIQVTGFLVRAYLPGACLGSLCEIYPLTGKQCFSAEVVGFHGREVLLMPLGEMRGVGLGSRVVLKHLKATVKVGDALLGRVLNGLGRPIDSKGPLHLTNEMELYSEEVNPLSRPPIRTPLGLGVKAIDSMVTVGRGQRVGIMAGSGVGKSVLMGMIAKNSEADVNVIAMVGERGREVREFVEDSLGEEGLKKSVVIVATSDASPLVRMRAAFAATSVAEYFSDQGKNVLFMMDSVTRFAMAQREIGLSIGEPPTTKGYTPSVFTLLPKLLERAGQFENKGSITGLYTVLVEGDDMDDPIGDSVRSIVDGHIVLSRNLAHKGHFPAIDVLQSASRVMTNVTSKDHRLMAQLMRENLALYKESEDLINLGAYKEGTNKKIDQAIMMFARIEAFLKQPMDESYSFEEVQQLMQDTLT